MSLGMLATHASDLVPQHVAWASMHLDHILQAAADHSALSDAGAAANLAGPNHAGLVHVAAAGDAPVQMAQAAAPAAPAPGAPGAPDPSTPATPPAAALPSGADYAKQVQNVRQEEQLSWLTTIGRNFIGVFQKGGETFAGFVTGIIPTLVVLMTAFYALTEIIGEQRVHGFARFAGRVALTRYTILPVLSVFFLTNPMAYTFGTFLEEKHKPAFYDSAVSFVHPILGLFPHANPGEYFVWGGVLVALQELESRGALPPNWHIRLAIFYFGTGLVVIFLKGVLTERITALMARRQRVEL